MMPFIGVRISWLMFARKLLLAPLAASAASFACCSSASVRFSDAAFHQMKTLKTMMFVSTNSDSPITSSKIPCCWAYHRSQPTNAGMRIVAGNSRRAITPPAAAAADDRHQAVGRAAQQDSGTQAERTPRPC